MDKIQELKEKVKLAKEYRDEGNWDRYVTMVNVLFSIIESM
jgi:hypothetical protein